MTQHSADVEFIARGYLRCSAELSREDSDPDASWEPEQNADQGAYELVNQSIRSGPANRAWELVLAVLRLAPDDRLGFFAAGPLEDLVKQHGAALLATIEAEAERDIRFRWALGGIWLSESDWPRAVLERLVRASDGRLKVLEWYPILSPKNGASDAQPL
jgi:hypothetical protein